MTGEVVKNLLVTVILVSSVIGVVYGLRSVGVTSHFRRITAKDTVQHQLARREFRNQASRVVKLTILFALAAFFLFGWPPPPSRAFITIIGLTVVTMSMASNAMFDYRADRDVTSMILANRLKTQETPPPPPEGEDRGVR